MAIDPLNPKPLKRVIRRNPKTKATDKPIAPEHHRSWSMHTPKSKGAKPAGESWWLKPENLERETFQQQARFRHPNKLGLTLKAYP